MAGGGGCSAFCLFGERLPAFVNSWSLCVSQMFPSVFVLISPRQGFRHLHLSQFQESSVHAPLVQKVFEHSGGSSFFLSGCAGSSLWHAGFLLLRCVDLSSCGTWAQLPHRMWDLRFQTKDQTCVPCIDRQMLNPWVIPPFDFICLFFLFC